MLLPIHLYHQESRVVAQFTSTKISVTPNTWPQQNRTKSDICCHSSKVKDTECFGETCLFRENVPDAIYADIKNTYNDSRIVTETMESLVWENEISYAFIDYILITEKNCSSPNFNTGI